MQGAIFLDRDGTLNFDYGWITSPEKIELLAGAAEAVRAIHEAGFLAVLVTNQPVIARGECTEADMAAIHERLALLLARGGARLDAIYYCPHHPDAGSRCDCRKPAPGLLERAARELDIDRARSWMIGDSERDLGAAAAFGIPGVLVESNQQAYKVDIRSAEAFRAPSVLAAVERIVRTARSC